MLEQGVRGLIEADQREAGSKDAKRDLVEAQITHGSVLLQSKKRAKTARFVAARATLSCISAGRRQPRWARRNDAQRAGAALT
jgi:hypothetical protein